MASMSIDFRTFLGCKVNGTYELFLYSVRPPRTEDEFFFHKSFSPTIYFRLSLDFVLLHKRHLCIYLGIYKNKQLLSQLRVVFVDSLICGVNDNINLGITSHISGNDFIYRLYL